MKKGIIIVIAIIAIAAVAWYIYIQLDTDECVHANDYCSRYDIDGNGVINYQDATLMVDYIESLGRYGYNEHYDMDCDEDIDWDDHDLIWYHIGYEPVDGPCVGSE